MMRRSFSSPALTVERVGPGLVMSPAADRFSNQASGPFSLLPPPLAACPQTRPSPTSGRNVRSWRERLGRRGLEMACTMGRFFFSEFRSDISEA
jgi:hypothetical protein